MILIVVPGEPVTPELVYRPPGPTFNRVAMPSWRPPPRPQPWSILEYSHGWPCEWLRRGSGYNGPDWPKADGLNLVGSYFLSFDRDKPFWLRPGLRYREGRPVSWLILDAWSLGGDAHRFDAVAFFIDLLLLVFVVVAGTALTEWRLRRRDRWWRFTLRDALALSAVLSFTLGWWRYHAEAQNREHAVLSEIGVEVYEQGFMSAGSVRYAYEGPKWLAKLCGNPIAVLFCWHINKVVVPLNDLERGGLNRIRELPWVDSLTLDGHQPPDHSSKRPPFDSSAVYEALRESRQIRQIDFGLLAVFREDIAALCELEQLKSIDVACTYLSTAELENLRLEYPHLTFRYGSDYCEPLSEIEVFIERIETAGGDCQTDVIEERVVISSIDFREAHVTPHLLEKLAPLQSTLIELDFGKQTDSQRAFAFAMECRDLYSLGLHQGNLTKMELSQWLELHRTRETYVDLYHATLSASDAQELYQEAERLQDNGGHCELLIYRGGPEEDDPRSIEPLDDTPAAPPPSLREQQEASADDPIDDPFADF